MADLVNPEEGQTSVLKLTKWSKGWNSDMKHKTSGKGQNKNEKKSENVDLLYRDETPNNQNQTRPSLCRLIVKEKCK